MRQQKLKNRITALLLCALLLAALPGSSAALEAGDYSLTSVTAGSVSEPGSVFVSGYQLYDADGAVRPVGSGVDFSTSVQELIQGLSSGEINASKDGFFETQDDAQQAIVKMVFDVAGRPSSAPIDVMFVLDESGSMNMYSEGSAAAINYQYTVPCMNENHYYKIEYTIRNAGERNSTDNAFYFAPMQCPSMNVWFGGGDVSTAFINEIKELIVQEVSEPGYGLEIANIMLEDFAGRWDFGSYHYYKDENGTFVQIPKDMTGHDETLDRPTAVPPLTGDYYSPPLNNAYGCVDRMLLAKSEITRMAQSVLFNNERSGLAWVSFAGGLSGSETFASTLPTGLSSLSGYDNTNYVVGLSEALRILQARKADESYANRQTYVVFMTDGTPNAPNGTSVTLDDGTVVSYAKGEAIRYAQQIRALENTTLYCVGINSGASDVLSYMAGNDSYFRDCKNSDEFKLFLNDITVAMNARAALVLDVLGSAYELVCDEQHPITVQNGSQSTAYSSVEAASAGAGVGYNETTSELEWRLGDVTAEGSRLTFYIKMDEAMLSSALTGYSADFPTNEYAAIRYNKVTDGTPDGVVTTQELETPASIKVEQSLLTAVKTSTKAGAQVALGESIPYTITLYNTGVLTLHNLSIADAVPEGTEYVQGSGGTLSGGNVLFHIAELAPGASTSVSFTVRVLAGTNRIVNSALFGTGDAPESIVNGLPVCHTNEIVNPRLRYALTVTKTVEGNLAGRNKAFNFTVSLCYYDGTPMAGEEIPYTGSAIGEIEAPPDGTLRLDENGQASFTLKHGQSITLHGVAEGGSYSVAEQDYSAEGYATSATGASAQQVGAPAVARFVNESNGAVPTGILLEIWPYIAIVLLALGGIAAALIVRRKKKNRTKDTDSW